MVSGQFIANKKTKLMFEPPKQDPLPEAKIGVKRIDDNPKLKDFVMREFAKKVKEKDDMKYYINL